MTARQVRAIAEGSSTAADLDILLAGQRSKCLVMLALVARMATAAGHPEAAAAAKGWRLLTHVQRMAPLALEDLVRYPAVSAWATETVLGLSSPSPGSPSPGRLALIAATAAIRGRVPCVIELPPSACTEAALHLPSLGSVTLPRRLLGRANLLRCLGETIEIAGRRAKVTFPLRPGSHGPGWRALPAITAGSGRLRIRVLLDDADPYLSAGYTAGPEPLTRVQCDQWRRRLAGGWHVLARDHSKTAAEVSSLIAAVVPLSGPAGAAQSITSRRAFGSVALSLPDNDMAMALTLAHEVQHAKLSALMDLLPMVRTPGPCLYYAPWRSDPRPLASLLQGMYAHLEVARFWRRHREVTREPAETHHANAEFARWRRACAEVAEVLDAHPDLTRCGSAFVEGMTHVLNGWRDDYVPAEASPAAAVSRQMRRCNARDEEGGNET